MAVLKLSKQEKDHIVAADHHAPRSVLGFHEAEKPDGSIAWVIRVMEPEAAEVSLYWENDLQPKLYPLKKIHNGGLFEAVLEPNPPLSPYRIKVRYRDGIEEIKHDPYYFSPQLTDYDIYLFNEGNHHNIYRKLGAHPTIVDGVSGTLFAVWAPNAKRVSIVGNFNLWDGRKHPMQSHTGSGIWELFIPAVEEGTIYKFEIKTQNDQILLKADPFGFASELRPATASIVADLNKFSWEDQEWVENRPHKNYLDEPVNIYEVHLGSWKRIPEEGNRFITYRESAETLIPYVKDMGYTHIELLPIAEHPFDASWGYQVTGPYAPTSRFGSPEDFMYFVNKCHNEGIGVIVDWVPAHFPKDAHSLGYFDGTQLYEHSDPRQGEHRDWGTLIYNYGRHEVRNYLVANALFWLEYYHIDGLRVDAVASMLYLDYSRKEGEWVPNYYGGRENLEAIYFLRQTNELVQHYFPGTIMAAEESTAWPGVSRPTYTGGLGFNFKWNMGWMNDTLRYIEVDPIFRKYDHHLMTFSMVYAFTENFVLPISHDEVVHGKGSLIEKMPGDVWQKKANLRLYQTFMISHPGKKLLFMGNEFGQWQEWNCAHSLDWHLLQYPDHQQLLEFTKRLNCLYKNNAAFYSNDFDWKGFEWIDLHDNEHSILSFIRHPKHGVNAKPIICVFNFTPVPRSEYSIGVPEAGNYRKILDSDSSEYGGSGYNQQELVSSESLEWQGRPYRIRINLSPLAALLFQMD